MALIEADLQGEPLIGSSVQSMQRQSDLRLIASHFGIAVDEIAGLDQDSPPKLNVSREDAAGTAFSDVFGAIPNYASPKASFRVNKGGLAAAADQAVIPMPAAQISAG